MHVTTFATKDYRRMPWKNGGGSTLELLQEAGYDGSFNWRLSIADVTTPGPFSKFDGIDRQIMLVNGNGMVLSFKEDAPPMVISRPLKSYAFKGEWIADCRLLDGAIQDFNVMVRRDWGVAAVNGLDLVKDQCVTLAVAPLTILHLLDGVAEAAGEIMHNGDTLRLDSITPDLMKIIVQSPQARLIAVSLKAH